MLFDVEKGNNLMLTRLTPVAALAQTLGMWWASEHLPMLPSYLVRNNSV